MTVFPAFWHSLRQAPTGWYHGLRATHAVRVLRWLRNGVLVMIVATTVLSLLVANKAHHQMTLADRTKIAVNNIGKASLAAHNAENALTRTFEREDVSLIGTGSDFANDTAQVNTDVTLAAEDNAAGKDGDLQIQFVHGQLTTCIQLAEAAVDLYNRLGSPAHHNPGMVASTALKALDTADQHNRPDTGGLEQALDDLRKLEQNARASQLRSPWLNPLLLWPLLLGPVLCMLLLLGATSYVLAQHFRRLPSPLLAAALLITATVAITVGILRTDPRIVHPATISASLLLLATAGIIAILAYHPRLAEYRFEPS